MILKDTRHRLCSHGAVLITALGALVVQCVDPGPSAGGYFFGILKCSDTTEAGSVSRRWALWVSKAFSFEGDDSILCVSVNGSESQCQKTPEVVAHDHVQFNGTVPGAARHWPVHMTIGRSELDADVDVPDPPKVAASQQLAVDTGQDIRFTWLRSGDFYLTALEYKEQGGSSVQYLEDSLQCWILTDTTIVIPARYVRGCGVITLRLIPVCGPPWRPGAPANLRGNGTGFLYAANIGRSEGRVVDLQVCGGAPPAASLLEAKPGGRGVSVMLDRLLSHEDDL